MRWKTPIAAATMTVVALLTPGMGRSQEMHVTRQVVLSTHRASPYVIVPTPDGGYVAAGSNGLPDAYGWAIRVDRQGAQIWQLLDGPVDAWDTTATGINRFTGVVLLSDNRVLLCGTRKPEKEEHAWEVGRLIFYEDPQHTKSVDISKGGASSIGTCFRWGDGIALVGSASKDQQRTGWVAKLDLQGTRLWSKTASFGWYLDAVVTAEQDILILSGYYIDQGTAAHLSRIDKDGVLNLDVTVPGGDVATFVRSSSMLQYPLELVTTDRSQTTRLITVDKNLKVTRVHEVGKHFDVKRAIRLNADAVTLFGSVKDRGDTAAVGVLRQRGNLNVLAFSPTHESFWINDAIADTTPGQFATLRQKDFKPVLMWISFGK